MLPGEYEAIYANLPVTGLAAVGEHVGMGSTSRARTELATDPGDGPVYALNLFDVADADEYRAYARRSPEEVARHGGRVLVLGRFRDRIEGDVEARQVMIVVEWESAAAFRGYRDDPALADLHPHREDGSTRYVWMLFDRLEDLGSVLGRRG